MVFHYADALDALGFGLDEEGQLAFDCTVTEEMEPAFLRQAMCNAAPAFREMRALSEGVLREPLSSHMQFKGLSFYYNYKMGTVEDNTFQIIETGMLADYAV